MAITKRPAKETKAPEKNADAFIGNAPDGTKPTDPRKGVVRGKREQISHTMPPELLQRLDEEAKKKGLTRAGLINLAISEYLEL